MGQRLLTFMVPLVLLSAGAGGAPASPPAGAQPTPPRLRLDGAARPVRYAARVALDPSQTSFRGAIDIDLELVRATQVLWLNGTGLTVDRAAFSLGAATVPARAVAGGEDFVGFAVDQPLPPGSARLHVEYRGEISRRDDRGLFAQKDGDRWYAITQLEAIFARRVFPCFDEPGFKVPWQLTLEVPRDLVALSNMPAVGEHAGPGGTKTVSFAPTPPLPAHLIAFAVGPYELVDAGKAGKRQVRVRIAAPLGRGKDAHYAASVSGKMIELLEDYFGTAYPYDKLDIVAIPITTWFGAMENPGMITLVEDLLVAQASNHGLRFERAYASVVMHELAHQWFGDLVTPRWWDDIWLNESFASWLEGKLIDGWHPEWTQRTSFVDARARALRSDVLVTARRIRQPIESRDEVYNLYDAISYEKGESVLAMFESFVGPAAFQKGIRQYLAEHANGNASSSDFVAAISRAAGRDLSAAWSTFLDQPGAPLAEVSLQCGAGQRAALAVSQQRFLPVGSRGSTGQRWQIPMCARWSAAGKTERTCTLLTAETQSLPLGTTCPGFLLANDQEVGYYRAAYPAELLQKLLGPDGRKQLSLAELVGVLDDVMALASAGRLPLGDALALTPSLAGDARRQISEKVIGIADSLHGWLVPDDLRPAYARYVQKLWGDRARALGWAARPGEDDDTRLLRPRIVPFVAELGEDERLRAGARELALKWLSDRRAVDADVVAVLLHVAARSGDAALFDRFHAEARRAADRQDRDMLLFALGSFPDPKLAERALAIVSSNELDPRESLSILWGMRRAPWQRQMVWDYLRTRFDALASRLTPELMATMPSFGARFCDQAHQREVEQFFKDRSPSLPGGPRVLAQSLETIELCRAYVAAQQPSVTAFLKQW